MILPVYRELARVQIVISRIAASRVAIRAAGSAIFHLKRRTPEPVGA